MMNEIIVDEKFFREKKSSCEQFEQFEVCAFSSFFLFTFNYFSFSFSFCLFVSWSRLRFMSTRRQVNLCYEVKRSRSFKATSFFCISFAFLFYFSRILIKKINKNIGVRELFFLAWDLVARFLGITCTYIDYLANCGNNPREIILDKRRRLSFVIDRQILNASSIFLSEKVITNVLGNKLERLRVKVD